LSTKIHTLVDALGNPLAFLLTPGQAHDLQGADALLPDMQADTLLADKAFDADQRVILPLRAAGKSAVIPPKRNRICQRSYDKELYNARENFYCKLKQFRAIATRYDKTDKTFSPQYTWSLLQFGSIEDRPYQQCERQIGSRALSEQSSPRRSKFSETGGSRFACMTTASLAVADYQVCTK
jgi:transposase